MKKRGCLALGSRAPQSPHLPKPHAHALAQPDVVGQADVGGEFQGEAAGFALFEVDPAFFGELGDAYFDGFLHVPADAGGQGEEVAFEEVFQELQACHLGLEGLVAAEVVLVQGLPVAEAVGEAVLPELELEVLEVDVVDFEALLAWTDAQVELPLLEEVVDVVGALLDADDAGLAAHHLVLDERVAVDHPAVGGVVVKEARLALARLDDRRPKARNIHRIDGVGKAYIEIPNFGHFLFFRKKTVFKVRESILNFILMKSAQIKHVVRLRWVLIRQAETKVTWGSY